MDENQPAYKELKQKLARAEELISVLRGLGSGISLDKGTAGYTPDLVLRGNIDFINAYIESEQNFRNSMDACPLGIRVITAEGHLFYANQAMLDITGYPTVEALKAVPREQLYMPESYAGYLERKEKRQRNENVSPEYEIQIKRPDGDVRTLLVLRKEIIWGGKRQYMAMYQDITGRRKMEADIIYLAGLVHDVSDAVFSCDKEFKILSWNKAAEKMYGWLAVEAVGKNVLEITQPVVVKKGYENMMESLRQNDSWTGDSVHHRKNGEAFYVLTTITTMRNKLGDETGAVSVVKDITERIKAEEALRMREEFLNTVIENTPSPLWVSDAAGTVIRMNQALRDLLRVTDAEVIGKYNVLKDSQIAEQGCLPMVKRVYEEGKTASFTLKYKTGRETQLHLERDVQVALEIVISAVKDEQGKVTHAICQQIDISSRIAAEKALSESQQRFYGAFHDSPSMNIIVNNNNLSIVEANDTLCHVTGYTRDELIGKNEIELNIWGDISQRAALLTELEAQGKVSNKEISLRMKNGEIRVFNVNLSNMTSANEQYLFASMIDITNRRKVEAALQASERRYRTSLDSMMEGCQIIDFNWRYIYVNDAFLKQSNRVRERFIGHTMMELDPIIESTKVFPFVRMCMKDRIQHRMENEIVSYEGSKWYDLSIQPVPEGVFILSLDITERKKAEMALQQNEERFRRIFQAGPLGITLANLDYKYTMVNARYCEMSGYSEKEILDMIFDDVSFPEGIDMTLSYLDRLKKGESAYYVAEKRYKKKNGELFWGSLVVTVLRDNDGKPQGFLSMVQDITSRKQDEDRIEHLNLVLRSIRNISQLITREKNRDKLIQGICNNLVMGRSFHSAWIVLMDETRQPVGWAATNVTLGMEGIINAFRDAKYPHCVRKALTQKKVIVTKNPAEHCQGCALMGNNEDIGSMTVKLETGGKLCGILCGSLRNSVLISEDEISLFSEVAADITFALRDIDLSSSNELLQQEQLRASKLESIGTLAGGIAHDFNNLLTGIMGNIGLAKTLLPDGSPIFDVLDEAEKAANRSRNLTQQLLTFARGGKPIKKVVNITGNIKDSATFALRGSKAKLELSLPEDLWLVEADEGQISQVIHNLVINADEAMPKGGTITINALNHHQKRWDTLLVAAGNYVRIDVRDNGIGIAPEHLQKIFEPYYTTKHQGSGLGLTTAYSIIKNHGGYLLAESILNQGSVFHVYLPASKKTAKGEQIMAVKRSTQAGGKVLVMDDDEIIRKMLVSMLKLAGYEVDSAADGAEAVEIYRQAMSNNNPFSAVIMDLTVPGGMGGKEAVIKLLEIDPGASVIVSSGYATDPIMSDYKKYGFSAVIAKPYSINQLQETLAGLNLLKKS